MEGRRSSEEEHVSEAVHVRGEIQAAVEVCRSRSEVSGVVRADRECACKTSIERTQEAESRV